MADPFESHTVGVTAPAVAAYTITPNDSTDLTQSIRAVTINGSGAISYVSSRDNGTYTTATLPAGTYPFFASRIRATGTTATDITGWV